MLMIFRIIFSIISFAFAGYGLITKNFEYQAYMMLFLSLTMLIVGIQEIQRNKKNYTGWLLIIVFVLMLLQSTATIIQR